MSKTIKLTVAQAIVKFLEQQYVTRDGIESPFFAGMWGIFGHGNVAGLGEALQQSNFPYFLARNEQAMTHTAIAYSKAKNRLGAFACTASVGPGSTNMITGAATATINRIPLLLFPSDTFARRNVAPVLQQLENPQSQDLTVNDSFRAVSKYWDRIDRPDQLTWSLLEAMRVLTSPDETGAVTICLPQDVQTETGEYDVDLFKKRVWSIPRNRADKNQIARVVEKISGSVKPFVVVGGGVHYSESTDTLSQFCLNHKIPVGETQAGKGALTWDHPLNLGSIGATGTSAANKAASEADLVLCIGTRLSDFTTASKSIFQNPNVTIIHINVCSMDAHKLSAVAVQGDAKVTLEELDSTLGPYKSPDQWQSTVSKWKAEWHATEQKITTVTHHDGKIQQPAIVSITNDIAGPESTVVCAAGSLPADLHKLWHTSQPGGYHLEYGYSCMGYEIAGGIGVKMARPERHVVVMVGDGSYQMMSSELITAVQENIAITVVVLDNSGFGSIGALSESVGSGGFGTNYRFRDTSSGQLDGETLPFDVAMNARSYGVDVHEVTTIDEFRKAMITSKSARRTQVIVVHVDKKQRVPSYGWWDVPVAEQSDNPLVNESRKKYDQARKTQKNYLNPIND